MPPTETEIQGLASKLAALKDPEAALENALRAERAAADREVTRAQLARKRLDDAELAKEGARLAEIERTEKAARLAEEKARADGVARVVARAAEHATGLVQAVEELRGLVSWEAHTSFTEALGPYVERERGHLLRALGGYWSPERYATYIFKATVTGTARVIDGAIARVRELDAKKGTP